MRETEIKSNKADGKLCLWNYSILYNPLETVTKDIVPAPKEVVVREAELE